MMMFNSLDVTRGLRKQTPPQMSRDISRTSGNEGEEHTDKAAERVLTRLGAELRERGRHELPGLMPTHDVGDLLSALLRPGAMEGGQRVLASDVTFGRKVAAGGLVRPVHAARLPQDGGGGRQPGRPVGSTSAVAEVAAAGRVAEDNGVQSCSRHAPLLGRLQPDARLFPFAAGASPQRAGRRAPRPLRPAAPSAPVPPRQRVLFLPN